MKFALPFTIEYAISLMAKDRLNLEATSIRISWGLIVDKKDYSGLWHKGEIIP